MQETRYILKKKDADLFKASKGFTTDPKYAVSFMSLQDAKIAADFLRKKKNTTFTIKAANYGLLNNTWTFLSYHNSNNKN